MSVVEEGGCLHSQGQRREAGPKIRKLSIKEGPGGRKGMEIVYLALNKYCRQ